MEDILGHTHTARFIHVHSLHTYTHSAFKPIVSASHTLKSTLTYLHLHTHS